MDVLPSAVVIIMVVGEKCTFDVVTKWSNYIHVCAVREVS